MDIHRAHLLLWQIQADPDLFSKNPLYPDAFIEGNVKAKGHWQLQSDGSLRIIKPKVRSTKQIIDHLLHQFEMLKDTQGQVPIQTTPYYHDFQKLLYKYLDNLLLQAKWEKLAYQLNQCDGLPVDDFLHQHLPELVLAYLHQAQHSAVTSIMGLTTGHQDKLALLLDTALSLLPQPLSHASIDCLAYVLHLVIATQETPKTETNHIAKTELLQAYKNHALTMIDKLLSVPGFHPDACYQNHTALSRIAQLIPSLQAELGESQAMLKRLETQLSTKDLEFEQAKVQLQQCEEDLQAEEQPILLRLIYLYAPITDHKFKLEQRISIINKLQQQVIQERTFLWEQIRLVNAQIRDKQIYLKFYIEIALRLLDHQANYNLNTAQGKTIAEKLGAIFTCWTSRHRTTLSQASFATVNGNLNF